MNGNTAGFSEKLADAAAREASLRKKLWLFTVICLSIGGAITLIAAHPAAICIGAVAAAIGWLAKAFSHPTLYRQHEYFWDSAGKHDLERLFTKEAMPLAVWECLGLVSETVSFQDKRTYLTIRHLKRFNSPYATKNEATDCFDDGSVTLWSGNDRITLAIWTSHEPVGN